MTRRVWALILCAASWGGTALVALAFFMHFTVRDRFQRPAVFYYATPWPVLVVTCALLAALWQRRGQRGIAAAAWAAALLALTCWLVQDWEWRPATNARGALRVVLWNVDRPERRFSGVAQWLRMQNADVIAIAERQPKKTDRLARWKQAFPEYQAIVSKGEMLCLVRGEVISVEEKHPGGGSFSTLLRTRLRGREVLILQADITGYTLGNRRQPLRHLAEIVAAQRAEPLILLGDLNTPRDSVWFAPLQAEATDAFAAVGRGAAATWPMPIPVLSLDQVWGNARLRPVCCDLVSSWRSDHRAVVAEFDFAP
jgi:vancomycin resistance protein VanJ